MTAHTCPGPGCTAQVAPDRLACARHWYQVPAPLRRAVWAAWKDGAGAGTRAHAAACVAAIDTMRPLQATAEG